MSPSDCLGQKVFIIIFEDTRQEVKSVSSFHSVRLPFCVFLPVEAMSFQTRDQLISLKATHESLEFLEQCLAVWIASALT